jgi:hypothetical protein
MNTFYKLIIYCYLFKMNLIQKLVPTQKKGAETGATARYKCDSTAHAQLMFKKASERLHDINEWFNICGGVGAQFQLTDSGGNELHDVKPEEGNLIRIKLPAPSNQMGEGYDWVRIEKIESLKQGDEELFGFRVRPTKNPMAGDDDSAHFYTKNASSSFLVYRTRNMVYAMERGRNEIPNKTRSLLNTIRNFFVGLFAMAGFSKPQWKRLVKGVLKPEVEEAQSLASLKEYQL